MMKVNTSVQLMCIIINLCIVLHYLSMYCTKFYNALKWTTWQLSWNSGFWNWERTHAHQESPAYCSMDSLRWMDDVIMSTAVSGKFFQADKSQHPLHLKMSLKQYLPVGMCHIKLAKWNWIAMCIAWHRICSCDGSYYAVVIVFSFN